MTEPKNRREAAERARRWLTDGFRLTQARGLAPAPHTIIWQLILDAVTIIEGLPDQEKKWLTSGSRSGGWNMIGMTADDAREIERARLMTGMAPGDHLKGSSQALDVERAVGVTEWLRYCQTPRLKVSLSKAAYLLAMGRREEACVWFRPNNRAATSRQRDKICSEIRLQACGMILSALGRDFGLGLDAEGAFIEDPIHV